MLPRSVVRGAAHYFHQLPVLQSCRPTQTQAFPMSLPIVTLDTNEKWDCHQCGICCRGSLVPLSKADAQRLRSQQWEKHPGYEDVQIMVPHRGAESKLRLAHRPDGSCVFLKPDGLCFIHSMSGLEAKPTICRTFPMQLVPQDKHAVLTYRRACPSAAADKGMEVKDRIPGIKKLVKADRLKADPIVPPLLKSGEQRDWTTIRSVLESVDSLLRDERYPPVRRVVHALRFARNIDKAKTRRMSDSDVRDLTQAVAELAPQESKPFFDDRKPPKGISKAMFRLMAVSVVRLHPYCKHESNWATRFDLAKTAWKCFRGKGQLPVFDDALPKASFESLEQPIGNQAPEVYLPLTRLIETNSATFLYALANRKGWTVTDSIRGLALLFPIGMWLLRWEASGQKPAVEAMLNMIVALDRSQGYQPLCGLQQRLKLSMLGFNGELERLAVWYVS